MATPNAIPSALLKMQLGKEVTFGTPVAPTVWLVGIEDGSQITPVNQRTRVQGMRGNLGPGRDVVQELLGGTGSLSMIMNYDQAPIWLDGLFGTATPAGSGPYTRTYNGATTAVVTPASFTLVTGAAVMDDAYGLNGATVFSVQFTGESNAPLMMTVSLEGEDVSTDAFASLTEPTVTHAMGNQVSVYLDAWGGTFGSTSAGCSVSYDITVTPGRAWKRCLGSLVPTVSYDQRWDVTGSISLEFNDTTDAVLNAMLTGSNPRYLLRIKATNGGAGAAERSLTIDVPVMLDPAQIFSDNNGMVTIDVPVMALEETTNLSGGFIQIVSVNGDADLYA